MKKKDPRSDPQPADTAGGSLEKERSLGMFDRAPVGVFQTTPEGRYLNANAALAAIYGFGSPAELIEAVSEIGIELYVLPGRRAAFMSELARHGKATDFESQVYCRDGTIIWISENAVAVNDAHGQLIHCEGYVTDITARREAEHSLKKAHLELERTVSELRATQQQVVQTERLAALGAMVRGVAHDFNNSLSLILGYGELLQQKCRGDMAGRECADYAEMIVTAASDAGDLVRRLSDFHRPADPGETQAAVSLNAAIEQAVAFTRPRWASEMCERGTPIELDLDLAMVGPMRGNAAELRELVTNLIFNAVDAMPQGGFLTLRTRPVGADLELSIADNGLGMSEEVRRRCLEPFFTTKGAGGSGLGLATVYGIVERHGGTVAIESTPGCGTAFVFMFPGAPEAAIIAAREPGTIDRPLRILVVDDQPVQCELLAHGLERDWHKVSLAGNGREALERFDRDHFDLVITDKAMPEMNGDQLAVAVKSREPGVPIIMLTGFAAAAEDSEQVSEFVDRLLIKPVSFAGLREAIADVMAASR